MIDLGFCFDLTTKVSAEYLKIAYDSFLSLAKKAGNSLPVNKPDKGAHHLDCAVINHLHEIRRTKRLRPMDTVKGVFIEGGSVFPTSMFMEKTHTQICVRNPECIKGVFRVKGFS